MPLLQQTSPTPQLSVHLSVDHSTCDRLIVKRKRLEKCGLLQIMLCLNIYKICIWLNVRHRAP